jgi:hypothetical protein
MKRFWMQILFPEPNLLNLRLNFESPWQPTAKRVPIFGFLVGLSLEIYSNRISLSTSQCLVFVLHLGLRLWPSRLAPPWLAGLVFGLSFSFGVMSLDYVTVSWLEVQRQDSFLVYVGLRKYRTLYLANVATYAPIGVICAALMGLSPQVYAIAGRILWITYAVMCPMRAAFILVYGACTPFPT